MAPRRTGCRLYTRRNRPQQRLEMRERLGLTPNHQAVAALKTPDPAAGAGIEVVNSASLQLISPIDVVAVIAVSAVDDESPGSTRSASRSTI